MKVSDFDYNLPSELIAKTPMSDRDHCRLMVLDRETGELEHRRFDEILGYLKPGDCLVLNDSKVLPARLRGVKVSTGANIEILLIKRIISDDWEVLAKPAKRLSPGEIVQFQRGSEPVSSEFSCEIIDKYNEDNATLRVRFTYQGDFLNNLYEFGEMPLPPYIDRPANEQDLRDYQTVYSRYNGSVAAPTAGLHFTDELLERIKDKGVNLAYVTLHVGIGTFRPVKCETVEEHVMHFEECEITDEASQIINQTIDNGGRIIAVGTTSTRTLESMAKPFADKWHVEAGQMSTGIFIYPGVRFKIIDALITNFHLPKSTLLMLVSAFYDREKILEAYETAIREKYRFFSYGDAMFIK